MPFQLFHNLKQMLKTSAQGCGKVEKRLCSAGVSEKPAAGNQFAMQIDFVFKIGVCMFVQKGFRSNKDLLDDFSEICRRNGLSDSACLNRLIWLYVCNDSLIQSRVSNVSIVQQFVDAYGDKK